MERSTSAMVGTVASLGLAVMIVACGPSTQLGAPRISTESIANGELGARYDQPLAAEGGAPPLRWSLEAPVELQWLGIDAASGRLQGTPGGLVLPAVTLTVTVTDAEGALDSRSFTLEVRECVDGSSGDCHLVDDAACVRGVQTCEKGRFGACEAEGKSDSTAHCGEACDACGPGADACLEGRCACGEAGPCDGATCCGGGCVDVAADLLNCGTCGNSCLAAQPAGTTPTCSAGACAYPCADGHARCPANEAACVDLSSNTSHCGGCGNACPTSAPNATVPADACEGGVCQLECDSGFLDLSGGAWDGCEVDTRSDPNHCGEENRQCAHALNTTGPYCENSDCTLKCLPGWGSVTGDYAAGCNVNLMTDPNNCGGIANVCPSPAHSTGVCVAGVCQIRCSSGWGDCNPGIAGCETNLNSSGGHCGACGSACASGEVCSAGSCCILECDPERKPPCQTVCF